MGDPLIVASNHADISFRHAAIDAQHRGLSHCSTRADTRAILHRGCVPAEYTLVTSTAEHERLHNAAQCAGREVREEMFEEVATLLHDLDDGMRPISVMFPYLPTAFHRKRDA